MIDHTHTKIDTHKTAHTYTHTLLTATYINVTNRRKYTTWMERTASNATNTPMHRKNLVISSNHTYLNEEDMIRSAYHTHLYIMYK